MTDYTTFANLAQDAVAAAAGLVAEAFRGPGLPRIRKDDGTYVTDADIAAQATIEAILRSATPDFGLYAEETVESERSCDQFTWIVDPIDGTSNFMNGVPLFAVQAALEHRGEVVAAALALPAEDIILVEAKGAGCMANGRKVAVSDRREFGAGIAIIESRWSETDFDIARALRNDVREIRTIASSGVSLAYVAMGRADMLVDWDDHPWDVAPGALLVTEAGGTITNLEGGDFAVYEPKCLASNGHLHEQLVQHIGDTNVFTTTNNTNTNI